MPSFVVAAIVAGGVAGAVTAISTGAAFAFAWGTFGASLVLGGISYAMRPKPPSGDKGSLNSAGRSLTIRQPIAPRQVVVGQARVGGVITYVETDGPRIHLVVTLAGHVSQEIGNVYFDDEIVPIGSATDSYGGGLATGKWAGYARIIKSLGDEAGQPFPELIAQTAGGWTDAHRQTGCTKLYIGLSANPDLYPGGLPNISAVVKGVKVAERRGSPTTTAWSANPALILSHYLCDTTYGMGADYNSEIDASDLAAAANVCDEAVALAGSPSTTESRYTCNGAFLTNEQPKEIIGRILASMAGRAVSAGGHWHIFAGAYEAPTVTLDESDLAGPIRVQALVSRRDNCNGVKGIFTDPYSSWQPTDFPPVASATYMAEDNGERVWRDVDFSAFVTSGTQAQRLAKIELLRTRQGYSISIPCKLTAFGAMTGRTVSVSNTQLGIVDKAFEVQGSRFIISNEGALGVELQLRETAAAVFDWSTSEEAAVDIAPNVTAGAAQADFALFAAGDVYGTGGAGNTAITDKYVYATDAVSAGTSLSARRRYLAGAGNDTAGVFSGGESSASTDKYTYSGNVVSAGTALSTVKFGQGAAGNSTRGIYAGGDLGSPRAATSDKYTWATDAVVAGTNLGTARTSLAGAGNETLGIFGGGYTGTLSQVTDSYTYASDTRAAGTNLGTARDQLAASANGDVGIFGGGSSSGGVAGPSAVTDKYALGTGAVASGTSLGLARIGLAAAGNETVGVYAAGYVSATLGQTGKYTYSGNTVAAGSSLGTPRWQLAGASSRGGFNASSLGFVVMSVGYPTTNTNLYDWATATCTGGTAIPASYNYCGSCGTSSTGYFGGGAASGFTRTTDVKKHAHAARTWSSGTALTAPGWTRAAACNSTVGVFAGGDNGAAVVNTTDKYTFSGDSVLAGSNLAQRYNYGGAGNATFAIFAGGLDTGSSTTKTVGYYTYSDDTAVVTTDLSATRAQDCGFANTASAIFGCGTSGAGSPTSTFKYAFASSTWSAGGNLANAGRWDAAGAANSTSGMFAGGGGTMTDIYTFATDACAAGTALTNSLTAGGAACSAPGHF